MRLKRLLAPIAVMTFFASASPALAVDWPVEAIDYEFVPRELAVSVGDTVTWRFANDGHTSTSVRGQAESWDSGTIAGGSVFAHTFTRPGRFQYICVPHQSFDMKGVVTVGTDTVARTIAALGSRRTGNRVRISFRLAEPARVRYALRGPSRRTVTRARLARGRHSFTLRRLKQGSYRGVLTATDDFDKKGTRRNSFVIR